MRPGQWQPPVGLTAAEWTIITRITQAKLFVFLGRWRHELFDAALQEELALAHLGHWLDGRARSLSERKSLFNLRRCAVVNNLHVIAALPTSPR